MSLHKDIQRYYHYNIRHGVDPNLAWSFYEVMTNTWVPHNQRAMFCRILLAHKKEPVHERHKTMYIGALGLIKTEVTSTANEIL